MTLREKVIVEGIPFVWTTNLSNAGIREFYEVFADRICEPNPLGEEQCEKELLCSWTYVKFRDGVCFWTASGNKQSVVFWTDQEWALRNARLQEIEELREEQAVERQLLEIEDRHLSEKTEAAIKAGRFDIAAAHATARMNLRLNSKGLPGLSYDWTKRPTDLWWVFTKFPTSEFGIEFIRANDAIPWAFESFAHWYAANCGLQADECAEQTWRIYDEGMRLFPDNAKLAKAACLFWRRLRRYDLATQICSDAIKKGLRDGTKSGFEGRMKRLEKGSKQSHTQRPIMNWFETAKAEIGSFTLHNG